MKQFCPQIEHIHVDMYMYMVGTVEYSYHKSPTCHCTWAAHCLVVHLVSDEAMMDSLHSALGSERTLPGSRREQLLRRRRPFTLAKPLVA